MVGSREEALAEWEQQRTGSGGDVHGLLRQSSDGWARRGGGARRREAVCGGAWRCEAVVRVQELP